MNKHYLLIDSYIIANLCPASDSENSIFRTCLCRPSADHSVNNNWFVVRMCLSKEAVLSFLH